MTVALNLNAFWRLSMADLHTAIVELLQLQAHRRLIYFHPPYGSSDRRSLLRV